jgi:oxygen-dependent protoporphyrinogen oxidase
VTAAPARSAVAAPLREIDCDVVVVGAGIAGLTAAWELRDRDVVVLESESRAGGRIRSETRAPYWLNLGPHVFPPPQSDLGRLVEAVGLVTVPIPGTTVAAHVNGRVVAGGRPETLPFRLRLAPSARASLVRAGLKIRRGVAEYLALAQPREGEPRSELRRRLLAYRDDTSFADFLGSLHPDADALLRAAVRRVSADPEELAAGAGVAQFAATFSGDGSLYHRNLSGGTGLLAEALADRLGKRLRLGTRALRVEEVERGVRVHAADGAGPLEVVASSAVVATPAHVAVEIVAGLSPKVESALRAMRYGPYVVAALLTNERQPMPWDRIYALVAARKRFNMFFNTASVLRSSSERLPGGSLTVYGAGSLGGALLDKSDAEVSDTLVGDLATVFPVVRNVVQEVVVQRWPKGIPYASPGRGALQRVLEDVRSRVVLAGDYLGERGGLDTAATSGLEAAALAARLAAR